MNPEPTLATMARLQMMCALLLEVGFPLSPSQRARLFSRAGDGLDPLRDLAVLVDEDQTEEALRRLHAAYPIIR